MEIVIGILLLLSFIGLAVYAIKGGNLFMGILLMACLWLLLPLAGNAFARMGWVFDKNFVTDNASVVNITFLNAMALVFQSGPESWGATLVNVVFGAWFGRIILDTGIASTLIKKTTEMGGDRPAVTCILLSIVTTAIFTSLFGAGAVVAIGVIILPILISLGIPKKCALISYTLSIGAGMFINPVLNSQYSGFFDGAWTIKDNLAWGFTMLAIQLVFTIGVIIFYTRKKRISQAWAAKMPEIQVKERPERKKLDFSPTVSLIAPIIPVILNLCGLPIIFGFLVGGFYALGVCGQLKSFKGACRLLNKNFFDGVVDAAPLVGFLLVLPMFNKAATLCSPYFNAVLGNVIPTSMLVIAIVFAVIAPAGMFRGPLTMFGCGAALLGILQGMNFPVTFLAPLFIIPSTVMNVSVDITQSWIAWGIGYTKVPTKQFLKSSLVIGWSLCIIMQLVTYFAFIR